jgi:hypothetical protein
MTQINDNKYVFVCGLHRSGTSLLGRNIARLENCTGFKNTGALMDEGQRLQDVYPPAATYGGVGRFGFDPRTHRTEKSELLTPQNVARLRASWHSYWDNDKTICIEKTPGNLLMTRFLQAAFPNSYFIVIRRHPVAVSMAGQKWTVNVTSLDNLFAHWLHCHELFEEDKKYLRHLYELRYEDYVADPAKYHEEIAAFLGTRVPPPPKDDKFRYVVQWPNPGGLRVPESAMEGTNQAYNQKYLDRWRSLVQSSLFKGYYLHILRKYEPGFTKFGYSLVEGFASHDDLFRRPSRTSVMVGSLYCHGADLIAFCQRAGARSKGMVKRRVKSALPEFALTTIRRVRDHVSANREASGVSSSPS